jgi:type I restriction enzyme S subunit
MTTVPEKVQQAYGPLPTGWRLEKLKFFVDVRNSNVDKTIADDEEPVRLCNYTDVYNNERITPNLEFMQGSATEAEIEKFQLKRGQVIITKDSEGWDDIGIPALVTEDMPDVLCGYHLSVFEPGADLDSTFLAWLCRAEPLNDQFKLSANGVTRFGLGQYPMKNAFVALPPLKSQRRIARFLDEKTARIDGLIEKKRALLDRLAEKRQALITRAVTKGLNPGAALKPSGIDWLGDIPAHWEVFLIKRHFDVDYGVGGEIDRSLDYGTKLLSLPNISKEGRFVLDEVFFTQSATYKELLQSGDLIFNWRNGSADHLGKTVRFNLDGEWTHVSFLLRLRAKSSGTHSGFLRYFVNGLRETQFFAYAKAGVNNTFNLFELKNLPVISPPSFEEQEKIADYLDRETSNIDDLSGAVTRSINHLEEYRLTTITNAIIGRVEGLQ